MHGGRLVLHGNATDARPARDNPTRLAGRIVGAHGPVFVPSENASTAHGYIPILWNTQIDAAENRVRFDDDLLFLGAGLAQIQLDASENRDELAAFQLLRFNAVPDPAENRDLMKDRRRA